MSAGGKNKTISVTILESALPIGRQFTHWTSVQFFVIALVAIGALVFVFLRYRAVAPGLEELGNGCGEAILPAMGPEGAPFPLSRCRGQ